MDSTTLILCVVAFFAGFVDSIVGGGGLIQTPAGLILLPNNSVAQVIGSLKIPSFSGTFFAALTFFSNFFHFGLPNFRHFPVYGLREILSPETRIAEIL